MKGDKSLEAGTPEPFRILVKEMQALGLDVWVGHRRCGAEGDEDFTLDDMSTFVVDP